MNSTEGTSATAVGGSALSEGLAGCSRSVEEMKARVFELNRMSAAIHEERAELEQKIAAAVAEYAVGQRVVRHEKDTYEITRIGRGYGVGTARYFGCKVLKAGTLGRQEFELYGSLKPANVEVTGRTRSGGLPG